jgi:ABC-type phosphate transport system substrate-binding protein
MTGRLLIFATLSVLVLCASAQAEPGQLAVIVHASRADAPEASEVAQIYLKRRRFWSNGDPIVPVNREGGSPIREAFARQIFGDRARRLAVYWNRQYFQGILPPATLASDEAVKRFVALERNAIGYIPADLVDSSVRVVLYLDTD